MFSLRYFGRHLSNCFSNLEWIEDINPGLAAAVTSSSCPYVCWSHVLIRPVRLLQSRPPHACASAAVTSSSGPCVCCSHVLVRPVPLLQSRPPQARTSAAFTSSSGPYVCCSHVLLRPVPLLQSCPRQARTSAKLQENFCVRASTHARVC